MSYSELDIIKNLTKEHSITLFNPTCIRQKSNMSQISKKYIFDSGDFEPELLLKDSKYYSPKLEKLLTKINELDKKDYEKHGKKFKHFIFSDLKSSAYGPKLISSALIANGFHLGYKSSYSTNAKKWSSIQMLSDSELEKHPNMNFYLLSSVSVYDKPISVKMKKEILSKFNQRPENINGEHARIIVMDSGFKEGIDLFDIKYIHIFEPSVNSADQKQVIGRGTRTCGQKGLEFHPNKGWSLHVFVYDLEFPTKYRSNFLDADTTFELYMKSINVDPTLMNFTSELEKASIYGSVDYELNQNIHNFKIENGELENDEETIYGGKETNLPKMSNMSKHEKMRAYINTHFGEYKWEPSKLENTCVSNETKKGGLGKPIDFNPTQNFIRHYFSPENDLKGMLLYHSTGTGKTCSAIAAASRNFEPLDYTILWVTRTSLKNDIWKNMFSQICNEHLLKRGPEIPDDPKKQMSLLSKSWNIRPLSYKQFSNLVSQENMFYKKLVKINGQEDPLRKTLLIIDEAHKLYGGGDLSSIERPDMNALHKSIMHSYAVSGKDSVRVLLMTATPITENPMELIQLINLCKPVEEQLPASFESFKDDYLDGKGNFTEKGYTKYLDGITGHISYLNREKDARQFAQPIIKRVLVKITDENQIQKFDKGIMKTELDSDILEMKIKTDEKIKELEKELNEMDNSKDFSLKALKSKIKEKYQTKLKNKTIKKGVQIVNKNIKELVSKIKDYEKEINRQKLETKNKMKALKKEIKNVASYKENEMKHILMNIKKYPEEYEKYKKSPFSIIKSECGKTIKTNEEVLEELEEHPLIQKYNNDIETQEKYIEQLKESLKIENDAFKVKMKKLSELLDNDFNDLEKSTLKMIITKEQNNYKESKQNLTKKIHKELETNNENILLLKREKRQTYQKVQKSLKNMLNQGLKKEKEKEKEFKKLNKTMKKIKNIEKDKDNETNNQVIKELVSKQESLLDQEIKNAIMEEKNNKEEKLKLKEEKTKKTHEKIKLKEEKQKLLRLKRENKEMERKMKMETKKLKTKKNITKKV